MLNKWKYLRNSTR